MPEDVAGTDVYYNGVWLRNCLTTQFDQTVEYDESRTDRLYTRFDITVETLVSEDIEDWEECHGAVFNRTDINHWNSQDKMAALHTVLSVPRGEFKYVQGGNTLLRANAEIGLNQEVGAYFLDSTDLNNGPKPRNVSIRHVIANKAYRVTFSIEVCVLFCGSLGNVQQFNTILNNELQGPKAFGSVNRKLLSNRFSIEETRDGSFYNTRTMIGRARVAHPALWDTSVRYLLLPMLTYGYKRESISFTHSSDGLDVAYRVIDRQRYAAPPWPAVDFQGNHTEATGLDGVVSQGSISVRMVGQPGTAKKYLLMGAVAVAESRIGKFGKIGEQDLEVICDHIQVSDVLHDNVVEFAVQFRRIKDSKDPGPNERIAKVVYDRLGLLPSVFVLNGDTSVRVDDGTINRDLWGGGQNRGGAPDPWGYEDAPPYGVFAQFLQDGCWPVHMTPDTRGYTGPTGARIYPTVDDEPAKVRVSPNDKELGQEPPPPNRDYENRKSEEQEALPYTYCELKIDYGNDYGKVALPKIKRSSGTSIEEDDVKIARLHAPICRKNIFVMAKRVGGQPKLPKIDEEYTDVNGITYSLDEFQPEFSAPVLAPDGQNFEYQINARIVYLMSRALKFDDDLTMGSLPWDNTTKEENKVSINTDQQDEEMV